MRQRWAELRRRLEVLFAERRVYVRSGGAMRTYVLTARTQVIAAGGLTAAALWMGVCTAAMLITLLHATTADRELARTQAKYERWIADRQARLDAAMAQLDAGGGAPTAELASSVEKRHAALALLLADVRGAPGAAQALTPPISRALAAATASPDPLRRVEGVRASQEELLDATDSFARERAERLRRAFRIAGISPSAYAPGGAGALGGPLIDAKDPHALAAVLDVDPGFAARLLHAATDFSEARTLADSARALPFARPTRETAQTSGFGVRMDPFTRHAAFHPGLDFAGGPMTPVYATAPGLVSFTGQRSGYGNTVEIDHGRGFMTRYAHLASIGVRSGQRVAAGQRLGGMGSTGRSTGTHLHYEVWINGRVQNPDRFVRAGAALNAG